MSYLVDSDILVDYLRHNEAAANYLDSLGDWSVSVVTGLELIAGAKDKNGKHFRNIEAFEIEILEY